MTAIGRLVDATRGACRTRRGPAAAKHAGQVGVGQGQRIAPVAARQVQRTGGSRAPRHEHRPVRGAHLFQHRRRGGDRRGKAHLEPGKPVQFLAQGIRRQHVRGDSDKAASGGHPGIALAPMLSTVFQPPGQGHRMPLLRQVPGHGQRGQPAAQHGGAQPTARQGARVRRRGGQRGADPLQRPHGNGPANLAAQAGRFARGLAQPGQHARQGHDTFQHAARLAPAAFRRMSQKGARIHVQRARRLAAGRFFLYAARLPVAQRGLVHAVPPLSDQAAGACGITPRTEK